MPKYLVEGKAKVIEHVMMIVEAKNKDDAKNKAESWNYIDVEYEWDGTSYDVDVESVKKIEGAKAPSGRRKWKK